MKINIKIYVLSLVIIFTSFSCEDTLDVNTDPLVSTSADPSVVLPFVFVQYSARKVSELGTRISDVSQHMSANFNSPRRGSVSSFLTGNTWGMLYTQVLGNLLLVEADAKAAETASGNNIAAIAIIMNSLAYYEATSIWGEVPFTQALNGQEFPSPTFDDQEVVLRGIVGLLDEALTLAGTGMDGNVAAGDLIYGGNMTQWRKFAGSLKLRVLMMIRNKDTSVDSQITALLGTTDLINDNADNAMLTYAGGAGATNAYQGIVAAFFGPDNESQGVHAPSPVFHDLIVDNNDPREGLFIFDPTSVGAPPVGNFAFQFANVAAYSNNVIRETIPDLWFTSAEIDFYRAELALKGVAGAGAAQANYEAGVTKVLEFWGQSIPGAITTLSDTDISNYVGTLAPVTLTLVHEQQYLEAFLNPVLAWNTVRRTKVPTLDAVPGTSISTYLKRFTYPPLETGANVNTPTNPDTDKAQWFEN